MRQLKLSLMAIITLMVIGMTAAFAGASPDSEKSVTVNLVNVAGVGEAIGTVVLKDTEHGLLITPLLSQLSPGAHGFHIHENPSCDTKMKNGRFVGGLAAGGHFDPFAKGVHSGPYGKGHLGDLPPLYVDADGNATTPTLAPRLKTEYLAQRSLMIHANGDNFSDDPAPLGGGGARAACGVIN